MCTSCPSGSYNLLSASSSCVISPAGYAVNATNRAPALCGKGYFSSAGSVMCTSCVAGTFSNQPGLSACSPCPSGFYCDPGAQAAVACDAGSYSLAGAASCTYCASGTKCPTAALSAPIQCNSGYYSLGGALDCTLTPEGYYSPVTTALPLVCQPGYYSSSGQTSCTQAAGGNYVPSPGAASPSLCPVGYYSSGGGASVCTLCNPGYMCPVGSTSASPPGSECPVGGYCNPPTVFTKCPPGSYGTVTAGQSFQNACTYCPEGYYCGGTTGTIADKTSCPTGYFCATGSSSPTPCPAGTSSSRTLQTTISTCQVCDKGTYCPSGSTNPITCPKNYFCGVSTGDHTLFPCAPGTFGLSAALAAASECTNCTAGHYCPGGVDPTPCPQGSFNSYQSGASIFSCAPCQAGFACVSTGMRAVDVSNICQKGYYCPAGSSSTTQYPCPAGTYSDETGLSAQSSCASCPPGYTCDVASQTADWIPCPAGYYCPLGTAAGTAIPCPRGSYSPTTKRTSLADCLPCSAGSYCIGGQSQVSGACAPGYYCPTNSTSPTTNACPAGTYTTSTSLSSSSSCSATAPGYYTDAGASVMVLCPAGRYSSVANTAAASDGGLSPFCQPCPAGSYCITGATGPTSCGTGRYSSSLSSVCTVCPKGTYCSSATTTDTMLTIGGGSWSKRTDLSGVCFPGTLCDAGEVSIPDLSLKAVPAGYWSPAGATSAVPCPAGTYVAQSGSPTQANCTTTAAGYYSLSASTAYTGMCSPGYYCPAGSTTPQQVPCPTGTYASDYGSESLSKCSVCPSGHYCPIASSMPLTCPRGYYCPSSTSEPEPCRPSKYGATSGLRSEDECTVCDPGSYCDGYGLQNPRGLCSPGYFCISGSNSSAPLDSNKTHAAAIQMGTNVYFGRCPRGAYCGLGTVSPILCLQGTYNGNEGGKSTADCTPCPSGRYCEGQGNIAPTGFCVKGYYCNGGAYTPTQFLTQPGYYTLDGADAPLPCAAGTYNSLTGQSNCTACARSYYCPNPAMTDYTSFLCPAGKYCPIGSITPIDCPPGTYSAVPGKFNLNGCTASDGGYYSQGIGNTNVTGPCTKGYYCSGGASLPIQTLVSATGGPCTPGHYCPAATSLPIPCPSGTYHFDSNNEGEIVYNDRTYKCTPCPAGKACTVTGLVAPNAICGAGYWCGAAASQVNASCDSITCTSNYGLCPKGSRCPAGSPAPTLCDPGTYQKSVGKAACIQCPARRECALPGATNYTICPVTKYCPAGTSLGLPCPNGTYNNRTGLATSAECKACPEGEYCAAGEVAGICSPGHFCKTGQGTSTPSHSTSGFSSVIARVNYLLSLPGGQCPAGHYCPAGCSDPIPCPNGTFVLDEYRSSAADCGPCPSGAICHSSNPVPEVCPKGSFCFNGAAPTNCPVGTYQNFTRKALLTDCILCPGGHYCNTVGIADYSTYACPAGMYCPPGTGSGTTVPVSCAEGTYLNTTDGSSQSSCKACPPYHYCVMGAVFPRVCPNGYYCSASGKGSPCPPTKFCPFGTSTPVPCPQTYYCPGNSSSPTLCQPGTYCPALSASPIACPLGYSGIVAANGSHSHLYSQQTACQQCAAGKYGTDPQRLVCDPGTPGYVFLPGATSAKPLNATVQKGYICPKGYYCPASSTAPLSCPLGTFQPEAGKGNFSDCISCAVGTYQYQVGSPTCLKCSSSSTSQLRSTSCTCLGLNRAFQPADGMCICKPGYEFVDASLTVSQESDGAYDCQPIVYSRCSSGTVRDSSGQCVSEDAFCNNFCGAKVGGTINPTTGTCDCTTTPSLDDICDTDCRAAKPKISCRDGMIVVTDSITLEEKFVDPKSISTDGAGALDCSVAGSKILTMSTVSGSFKGVFGAPASVNAQLNRRRLLSDGTNVSRELSSDPTMSNPIVCMQAGDSIVFSVSNAAYPVYEKDSMLNTNPNFDYAAFRSLATQAASERSISTFPFTFVEVGTYAFKLGSSPSITVISVVPSTISCSTDASFAPLTQANLAKLGVSSNSNFVLSPEWNLVIGLLLGMLGLAILVASFLYYFRSRAWSWHEPIEPRYRLKNQGLGEPKGSKGGIWSMPLTTWPSWGPAGNKANEDNDTDKRRPKPKGIRKQSLWDFCCGKVPIVADEKEKYDDDFKDDEEIDTAVAKKNSAESEFEDDMLIPELAKHMQEQHDKIDRQLAGQKDMMKKLRNTLRKEVDELKALLSSTALEMSNAGGTDAARAKKLRALLLEVKGNTMQRISFRGNEQSDEVRLVSVCEKIHKMVDGGVSVLVNEIIQELASSAVSAQDRDESTISLISPALHNLLACMEAFSSLTATLAQASVEEKRRVDTSSAAFNHSLKISHVMFPDDIFELMNQCEEASVEGESFDAEILNIVRAFADRSPLFSSTILKSEAGLSRALSDIIEQGANEMLEKERVERVSELTDYLAEFIETANMVQEELKKRRDAATVLREQEAVLRTELVNAIDAELAILASTQQVPDFERLMPGLLAALHDGKSTKVSQAADVADDAGENRGQLGGREIDAVINNDDLTIAQKEEMLGTAETDRMVMQNMIDMQRKAQEQLQQDLLDAADRTRGSGSKDINMASLNAAEAAVLEDRLRNDRDGKIEAMMRCEYFATVESDGPHDARIAALAVNRYSALLRCFSVKARLHYQELQVKHQRKRLDACQTFAAADNSVVETINIFDTPEIVALDKLFEEDFAALAKRLRGERSAAVATEDALRAGWQKNPAIINVEAEMQRLTKESDAKFLSVQNDYEKLSQLLVKMDEDDEAVKMKLFNARSSEYSDDDKKEVLDSLRKEIEINRKICTQRCAEFLRALSVEHDSLGLMLSMSDSWGPLIDHSKMQGQLFLRIMASMQIYGDVRVRLVLTEHELKSEVLQIKTEIELRKRQATEQELQVTWKNLSDAAAERASVLVASTQAAFAKAIAAEKQRQELSIVDFERERADAIEKNAQMQIQLSLDISKSRREIRTAMADILSQKAHLLPDMELPPTLHELSAKQMRTECMREELELNAAYSTFELESLVSTSYSADMVEGMSPSVGWAQPSVRGAGIGESRILIEALINDKAHRRLGKQLMSRIIAGLEENRLLRLGRPAEDLGKVYADLNVQLDAQYKLINESWQKEKTQILSMQSGQVEDKMQIHETYAEAVSVIMESYEEKRSDLKAKFNSGLEPIRRQERSLASEKEKLVLSQHYASDLASLNTATEEKLVEAFTACNAKLRMVFKLEDELRHIRNNQQQTSEALENTNDGASMTAYLALLDQQSARHNQARKMRDDYDLELNGLNAVMAAKKKKQAAFLKERLEKKREARERELQGQGLSASAAAAQVAKELENDKSADMQAAAISFESQAAALRKAIDGASESGLAKLQAGYKKAIAASDSGLAVLHNAEKAALDARLAARKAARQNEFMADGKTLAVAKKLAEREISDKAATEGESLRLEQLSLDATVKKDIGQLYSALEDQISKGYAEEIRLCGESSSVSAAESQRRVQKLTQNLADELVSLKEQNRHGLLILENGWQKHSKQEQERLQGQQQESRAARKADLIDNKGLTEKEANVQLDVSEKEAAFLLTSLLEAARKGNQLAAKEASDALVVALQLQHAAKLKGFDESQALMVTEGRKAAVEKVAKRRELREKMVVAANLNSKESKSLLDTEQSLLMKSLMEELDRITSESAKEHARGLKRAGFKRASEALDAEDVELGRIESDEMANFLSARHANLANILQTTETNTATMVAAVCAASKAAIKVQEGADLQALRRAHDEAYVSMQERFKLRKAQEEKALNKRLEERRQKRSDELRKENMTTEAIAATLAAEEQRSINDLARNLQMEEEEAKAQLAAQTVEAERIALEKERVSANNAIKTTSESNQQAQARVDDLRAIQEAEFKRLLEVQRLDREANEKNLKARLAEKKEAKLRLLADKKATAEECAIDTMRMAEEEHARLVELERDRAEQERRAQELLRKEQERALAVAVGEAARLEAEAAAALSKSSVLATMQENVERAEAELNAKELKRLKDVHEVNANQAEADEEQRKGQKHMKLEERLQAKRDKKKLALQEQEERARAELSNRQAAEAEERDRLQRAKEGWSAALQKALSRANAAGLTGLEKEDFLLKEILGSKSDPVPNAQHAEVVQEILKARHHDETSALLNTHGEERISALKAAAEACIAEKGQARIALIEQLNKANASPEEITEQTLELDGKYSTRQLEEENKVSAAMDPLQLRQQMDLKERQIKEIAQRVRAYTDASSTFVAASSMGYLEELAEYRANLEAQKEARKESLLKERQEAEASLRQEMDQQMKIMQEMLAAEQRKVEDDLEQKKRLLLKQKEEVDKKHSEDLSQLDTQEAGRIKEKFEKEHAAALDALESERLNKKARLQDRLAKKRKNIVVEEAVVSALVETDNLKAQTEEPSTEGEAAAAVVAARLRGAQKKAEAPGQQMPADPAMMKALTGFMRQVEKKLEKLDKAMAGMSSETVGKKGVVTEYEVGTNDKAVATYKDTDEPAAGEMLVVIKLENLHMQERARIDFGLRLASMLGLSRLRIKAASSLPTSTWAGNAFANSYLYVPEDSTLYVHVNRLGTSGDTGVVMIHALSHIKVRLEKDCNQHTNEHPPRNSLLTFSLSSIKLSSTGQPARHVQRCRPRLPDGLLPLAKDHVAGPVQAILQLGVAAFAVSALGVSGAQQVRQLCPGQQQHLWSREPRWAARHGRGSGLHLEQAAACEKGGFGQRLWRRCRRWR